MVSQIEQEDTQRQISVAIATRTNLSLCIIGAAGTGKTVLIKQILKKIPAEQILCVAPTALAAKNINGNTIHSTFGIPSNIYYPSYSFQKRGVNSKRRKMLKNISRIIIDEISMVSSGLLQCIDFVLRSCGDKEKPFGGKQMIFVGDPSQLPPIISEEKYRKALNQLYDGIYYFQSPSFNELNPLHLILNKNYRQQDAEFIGCLRNMQLGINKQQTVNFINKKCCTWNT